MTSGADANRLILRGGGSAAAGYAIRFGARLLFLFVAARLFGVALFGAYALAVAAVELGVAIAGLGLKRYLFHLLETRHPDRPAEHVVVDAAILVLAAGLILAAGMMLAALLLPSGLLAENTATGILVVAPMVAGQALLDLFLAATRWKQRMRYEVTARSIVEPYVAIAAAAAAFAAGFDETGLLISYWAGTLAALAYGLYGARLCFGGFGLSRYRLSLRRLGRVLKASLLPTMTDLTGGLFARLDLYLVGIFLGEVPAGIYGMARQMRTPARQVRQSFDGLLTPIIARTLSAKGEKETGVATASAARLILTLQLVVLIAMLAIGRPVLEAFGPDYAAGYGAMIALVAAETILGAFGVGDLVLLYRRPELTLAITGVSIVANLAAAWFLIGRFGLDGAALSVLVAVTAGALLRRILLRSRFGIVIPLSYCAGPVAAAAVGIAAVLLIDNLIPTSPSPWIHGAVLIGGLAVYAGALALWLRATGDRLSLVNMQTE